jgi:hypothetical protein
VSREKSDLGYYDEKVPFKYAGRAYVIGRGARYSPVPCRADALDSQLDCKSSAPAVIAPLLHDRSIDSTPMRVEANSVNAF